MKVKVWVLATTIPEAGAGPCMPFVFGSQAQAEAQVEASLRAEWNAAGVTDDETGAATPYPGDWRQAQDQLVKFYGDGSWGPWEINEGSVRFTLGCGEARAWGYVRDYSDAVWVMNCDSRWPGKHRR